MINFFVKRPISVIALFSLFLVLATINLLYLPSSFLPDIDVPRIKLLIENPVASAQQLEQNITQELRHKLAQLQSLENLESTTVNGLSEIKLEYNIGTDIEEAFLEVSERLEEVNNLIEDHKSNIKLIKERAIDIPALYVNFYFNRRDASDYLLLSNWIRTTIKNLEKFREIALIDVTGLRNTSIQINLDKRKMIALGIEEKDIRKALKNSNSGLKMIKLREGSIISSISYGNLISSFDQLKKIGIQTNHSVIRLDQIANIEYDVELDHSYYYFNGKPAIGLAIILKPNVDTKALIDKINRAITNRVQNIQGLLYSITQNQLTELRRIIGQLQVTLLIGCSLTFLLMLFFLGKWDIALVCCFTIVFSLLITLLCFSLFSITINLISLFGLILSVGLMIDNAIIITDNIGQHMQVNPYDRMKACILGTNEVASSLITSNLTTCIIFLPITLLNDLSGTLFGSQATVICIGIAISLLTGLILIPTLIVLFKLSLQPTKNEKLFYLFRRTHNTIFSNPLPTLILISAFIAFSCFLGYQLKVEKLPQLKESEVVLTIIWSNNIGKTANLKRTTTLLDKLSIPGLESAASIGPQDFVFDNHQLKDYETKVYFKCNSPQEVDQLKNELTYLITNSWKNTYFYFEQKKSILTSIFNINNKYLYACIRPKRNNTIDDPTLYSALRQDAKFQKSLASPISLPIEESVQIALNLKNMLLYEVSIENMVDKLKGLTHVEAITHLRNVQPPIPIQFHTSSNHISAILHSETVKNSSGKLIPIKLLIKLTKRISLKEINADLEGEYLRVPIYANNESKTIRSLLNYFVNHSQFDITFKGGTNAAKVSNNQLVIVFLASIFLLYFILTAQFESFIIPLIILVELPVSLGGSIIALFILGESLNVMSIIGMIVMLGIVINDSIIKIDTINKSIRNGEGLKSALLLAGERRLKAILMTSLTTVLSITPLLFTENQGSNLQIPLGISIIGGLVLGTFISLYVVPLFYYYFKRNS